MTPIRARPVLSALGSACRCLTRSEAGSVSVEWVVLAAGVTAMSFAMLDSQKSALSGFWDVIVGEVSDAEVVRGGEAARLTTDFESGPGRWHGGAVTDVRGFGNVLGPIGGSGGAIAVSHDYVMTSGVGQAVLTFDLLGIDSLDFHADEEAVFYINGQEVGRVKAWSGGAEVRPGTIDGVTFAGEVTSAGTHIGGYRDDSQDWLKDSITRVTITVDRPGDVVSFGMGSTADQDVEDESFALDNLTMEGK